MLLLQVDVVPHRSVLRRKAAVQVKVNAVSAA